MAVRNRNSNELFYPELCAGNFSSAVLESDRIVSGKPFAANLGPFSVHTQKLKLLKVCSVSQMLISQILFFFFS